MSAQLVLLFVVVTALTIKRHRERPKRPMPIWLLDISKQACSAAAGHVVGMAVAMIAHVASHGASECGWYFIVYFGDCTLGLTLAITFHKLVNGLAHHYSAKQLSKSERESENEKQHTQAWWEALVEIGNYGDPPNYKKWGIQVVFWVCCVVTARLIVGVVVISNIPMLQLFTRDLDARFAGRPDAYIFTVMVGIPVVINIGQAWIQDQVLKWRHRKAPGRPGRGGGGGGGHADEEAMSMSLQQAEVITASGGRRGK